MTDYQVTVQTGDEPYAGTNARVYICLFGDRRMSPEILLSSRSNTFVRGKIKKIRISTPDVGAINKIRLRHDNSRSYPGWLVQFVLVRNLETHQRYYFPGHVWLKSPNLSHDFLARPPQAVLPSQPFRTGTIDTVFHTQAVEGTLNARVYFPMSKFGETQAIPAVGRFPVVVFAHGKRNVPPQGTESFDYAADFNRYNALLGFLAAWGFVVISPDIHQHITDPQSAAQILKDAVFSLHVQNGQTSSLFHHRIDLLKVGFIGHSTGGMDALRAATDPAFAKHHKALILLAAISYSEDDFTAVHNLVDTPVLVVQGGNDTGSDGAPGYPDQYFRRAVPPRQKLFIVGANHFQYTDDVVDPGGDPEAGIPRDEQIAITKAFFAIFFQIAFFDEVWQDDYLYHHRPVEGLTSDHYQLTQHGPHVGVDS